MSKKSMALKAALLILACAMIVQAGPGQDKKAVSRPPHDMGPVQYPAPQPVAPPEAGGPAAGLMEAFSHTQAYSAARVSSYERKGGPRDKFWIPNTGEEFILAEIQGPGAITHIWNTFRGTGRDLIFRIYWDGSPHPSVEAPIGDFFGVAMGADAPLMSLPIQVSSEGRARNCWWYMPFAKSAKVTVAAAPGRIGKDPNTIAFYSYIDYQKYARAPKDLNYFHARFRETDPAERGRPVTLVEAEGAGHFLGVVMGNRTRTPGWFGEGDDIITVDGTVSFLGTGTEDYFSDAWGFRLFTSLYHGVPFIESRGVGSRVSVYRFHLMDPIPFLKSFKFEIEHWPWISPRPNSGRDYFSSVGFWYQSTVHKAWPRLERLISSEPWDPSKGRWFVKGALEGEDLGILGYKSKLGPNVRPDVVLALPNLSGDRMLDFDSGGEGDVTLLLPSEAEGSRTLKLYLARGPDRGIVTLSVNGVPVGGELDTYLRRDDLVRDLWPPAEYVVPGVVLKKGVNELRLAVNKKNPEADGFKLGLDCLVLEPK